MGDLIAFGGYVNQTTPFNWDEYDPVWKSDRRYHDFQPGSERNLSCQYPRMWGQDGLPLTQDVLSQMHGCRESEFDLVCYIDSPYDNVLKLPVSTVTFKARGLIRVTLINCPSLRLCRTDLENGDRTCWRRSKSCPAFRLPCWTLMASGNKMSSDLNWMLNASRMDKALQTTPDAMAEFTDYQRDCAKRFGKDNFMVVGEVVGDPRLAAVYFGRGKEPPQYNYNTSEAVATSNYTSQSEFIRDYGLTAIDGAAFHYDIYGSLTRFLG